MALLLTTTTVSTSLRFYLIQHLPDRRAVKIIYSDCDMIQLADLPLMADRREQLSRRFFDKMCDVNSCLYHLLPAQRDTRITNSLHIWPKNIPYLLLNPLAFKSLLYLTPWQIFSEFSLFCFILLCFIYIHLYSPKTVEICELYSYIVALAILYSWLLYIIKQIVVVVFEAEHRR